jgi:hypothetical protein
MKSRASSKFWASYQQLPSEVQQRARKQYRLWTANPEHRSLRFEKIKGFWSARIDVRYRALGVMDGDTVVWFWIGAHDEYEQILKT